MENIFSSFAYSGQGLSVQRQRLSAVAKNIANANTTRDDHGQVYKREVVVVQGIKQNDFSSLLETELPLAHSQNGHLGEANHVFQSPNNNIMKSTVAQDTSSPRMVYDPSHPDADKEGYVKMPNVNIVTEMVDMITAQRSFEANTGVISAAKNMAKDTLEI